MSAIQSVNPNADLIGSRHAQTVNIGAAKSLQSIVQTNLGPRGTMKMSICGITCNVSILIVLQVGWRSRPDQTDQRRHGFAERNGDFFYCQCWEYHIVNIVVWLLILL